MAHSRQTLLVVAFFLALLPIDALRGDDWPQWRGPHRDSVCAETDLLESFPAEGLKVRWRAPAGWGFSSPIVAEGRVYLAGDAFGRPRVQTAWLSGRAAARAILQSSER